MGPRACPGSTGPLPKSGRDRSDPQKGVINSPADLWVLGKGPHKKNKHGYMFEVQRFGSVTSCGVKISPRLGSEETGDAGILLILALFSVKTSQNALLVLGCIVSAPKLKPTQNEHDDLLLKFNAPFWRNEIIVGQPR